MWPLNLLLIDSEQMKTSSKYASSKEKEDQIEMTCPQPALDHPIYNPKTLSNHKKSIETPTFPPSLQVKFEKYAHGG
jgi:hypothetical protein